MLRYIGRRLLHLIPILIGITFLSFGMMRLAGGDPVTYLYENAGAAVSQEVVDRTKAEYGLDDPFLVQYGRWAAGMLNGDMGTSYVSHRDVYDTFVSKLPATLALTAVSVLLTAALAVPLGILAAVRQGRLPDLLVRLFSFVGTSLPGFALAVLLIYVFCIRLQLLPTIATADLGRSIVLPALTLAIPMTAKYARQIRAAVLEELGKDYVAAARARGIPGRVIVGRSVLRASLLSIVTLLALSIGSLLGGTTIVETIFMWDGVGKMAVDAIDMRDYPIIQAYVAWMAVIYVAVNLVSDILCWYLDPQAREGGGPS